MNAANLLRGFFALLLLATGVAKLLDMSGFVRVVDSFEVLPPTLLAPSAWALALTELSLSFWLIAGRQQEWAALALMALHAAYALWVTAALLRGLDLPNCGCFGAYLARPLRWHSPLEDLALLLLALWLWRALRAQRA